MPVLAQTILLFECCLHEPSSIDYALISPCTCFNQRIGIHNPKGDYLTLVQVSHKQFELLILMRQQYALS